MVKTLELSADRIRFRNPAGDIRLDTDFGLFHVVGSLISGSQLIPAVGGSGGSTPNISQTNDYTIATGRNAACTHVVGAVYFSVSGNAVALNRWTSYMGGSVLWIMDNANDPSLRIPTIGMIYSFFMSGTDVIMRQEVRIDDDPTTAFGAVAHTISWKMKTGLWT